MKAKPKFKTNKEALINFNKEYEALGGDSFWLEAENSNILTENHRKVMRIRRCIQACKYLIDRGYK